MKKKTPAPAGRSGEKLSVDTYSLMGDPMCPRPYVPLSPVARRCAPRWRLARGRLSGYRKRMLIPVTGRREPYSNAPMSTANPVWRA